MNKVDTSWEKVSDWYNKTVNKEGSYYHKNIIIPKSINMLNLSDKSKVLDLACGQGILSRNLPKIEEYVGVDISNSLIAFANKENKAINHKFITGNITKALDLPLKYFSHAVIILAIQNSGNIEEVIKNATNYLKTNGTFLIVINHPCFRIPKYSEWNIDYKSNKQTREIYKYMSYLEIPIEAEPSQGSKSEITWSFHYPISKYSQELHKNGFVIENIEEWISDKVSVGKHAEMENKSRQEIPLFMAISSKKAF
jgi:ubiquinone/menaquinone biosynthesis C-methylase UbiE